MSLSRIGLVALAVALVLATAMSSGAHAQTSDADIAKMMEEIVTLSAEQKELPKKVEANLTLKKKHETEYARIATEDKRLKADSAAIEADRPGVNSLCTGTFPEEELAAATARCNAVLIPFNARIEDLKARVKQLADQSTTLGKQEDERFNAGKALQGRAVYLENRLKQLKMTILLAKRGSCVKKCQQSSAEVVSQCLSCCWDLARCDLPSVEQKQLPVFKATTSRTPEQAIEEYKNSGRAAPPAPKQAKEPPPPSTSP
jgi:hypothetical protein